MFAYLVPYFKQRSNSCKFEITCSYIVFILKILQLKIDKMNEFKRPMYFPLLSVLKGGEEHDTKVFFPFSFHFVDDNQIILKCIVMRTFCCFLLKGSKLRMLLFIIYCTINVAITFTLVGKMLSSSQAGCGFGPTTCTHSDRDTRLPNDVDVCNTFPTKS